MERELWHPLYPLLKEVAKDFRPKYVQIQPWVLVAVMLWAALHDPPVSWACQRRHWSTTTLKPWRLPSPSTMSRRIDAVAVGLLWRALERRLRDSGRPALVAFVDGKPLPVGGNYDASYLYDAAFDHGYQLVSPCREAKTPGCGKHYQSPHRPRGLAILQGGIGKALFKARTAIERSFGNATSLGGGLGPLPAWVRGLERERTWVWAKLLINAVRIRYG